MAILTMVRPNLGNPLILTPEKLRTFEITIAGKSPIQLDAALVQAKLQSAPPQIARADKPGKYYKLTILRMKKLKRYAGFNADYCSQKLPITNTDHQYVRGFRWEYTVDVGLTDSQINQMQDQGSWPVLCNLKYASHNLHSVYVHESLKDSKAFTIFQLSDLHIAHRNDKIPELLCQVRTQNECNSLKSRYVNFNDNLRAVIQQINKRVRLGEKIIVVATGDLIDYYYDGFWDGEFIWKKGKAIGWENCNFNKLVQIISGSDGKGQALLCPIFTILGNHDYLIHETLPNVDLTILGITFHERNTYGDFGLSKTEGQEYCYWAYPKKKGLAPSLPYRKVYKNLVKNQDFPFVPGDVKLDSNHAYWLGKPHFGHLGYYLEKINYDMDFSVNLGQQQLVFLNTGPGRYGTKEQMRDNFFGLIDVPDYVEDFAEEGQHTRGISKEHIKLVKAAMQNKNAIGTVIIFTHAPLVGLHKDPIKGNEVLFEDAHNQAPQPPNNVSEFLLEDSELGKATIPPMSAKIKILQQQGYTLCKKKYFLRGNRDPQLNFGCADGDYLQLFALIRQPTDKPVVVLSGHTHKVHEFRIEGPKTATEYGYSTYYYFADDYSKKIKAQTSLVKKWEWLKTNSPLLLVSGGMKNTTVMAPKYKSHYREIQIVDNKIHNMDMVYLNRIPLTTPLTPGCRNIALRAPNGRYVCAENGGGGSLVANRTQVKEWETFELFQWAGGKVALQSYNGAYLRAEDGGGKAIKADRVYIKSHETFYMFPKGQNKVILQTNKGQYMALDSQLRLVAKSKHVGAAAVFTLV